MEKVNIKFYDNYTVSYQHKKILQFVPELSVDKNLRIMTPNIPLLVSEPRRTYHDELMQPNKASKVY